MGKGAAPANPPPPEEASSLGDPLGGERSGAPADGAQPVSPQRPAHSGDWLGAALHSRGVRTVFTLPGGQILPLLDGLRRAGVDCVDVHHEGAAAQMAVGWTMATGRPGVAVVTAGAGFTNALSGLADGVLGRQPLRLIAGRTDRARQGRGAVQDLDQLPVARALGSGVSSLPPAPEAAVADLLALWDSLDAAPPRAHYVEVTADTAWARVPSPAAPVTPAPRKRRAAPSAESIAEAQRLLAAAQQPLVLCGSGAFWSGAGIALRRFVERTGIPAITTSAARGLLTDRHQLALGGLFHGALALPMADCVLVVGTRFDGNLLFGAEPLFPAEQRLVLVDRDPAAATGGRRPDHFVEGDAAMALDRLSRGWGGGQMSDEWPKRAQTAVAASQEMWGVQADGHPAREGLVHPASLARTVQTVLGHRRLTVVVDGGDILTWSLPFLEARLPGSLLTTSTTLGTVGVGLPYAIAAALAHPDRLTVLITGDGSLGLAAMELATAVRHGVRLLVLVSNNGSWGDVRHYQLARLGPQGVVASIFGDIRFDQLAAALGATGVRVTDEAGLLQAVRRGAQSSGVTVVDVATDPDVENWLMEAMGTLGIM